MKKTGIVLLLLIVSGLTLPLAAQNKRITDSLEKELQKELPDTARFHIRNNLITEYRLGNAKKAMELCQEQLLLAEQIGLPKFRGKAMLMTATQYRKMGDYEASVRMHLEALDVFEKSNDELNAGNVKGSLGIAYWQQGNLDLAVDYMRQSIVVTRKFGKKFTTCSNLNNIGGIFFEKKQYDSALVYLQLALPLTGEIKDTAGMGDIYGNMGSIYLLQNKLPEAMQYSRDGIHYSRLSGNEYALQTAYGTIGGVHTKQENYPAAIACYDSSLAICLKLDAREGLRANYKALAEIYAITGNFEKAYSYQTKYADIKDSLLTTANLKQINEMEAKYQSAKKDKQLLDEKSQSDKKSIIIYAASAGLLLMIGLTFFVFRSYRIKQKSEAEIGKQKTIIEEQNKEILDSIHYAERIQQSLLPSEALRRELLPDSFVFYQPRSIVAGDFYWITEQQGLVIFAVADCTGHGVPGALMSVVCTNALNRTVNEFQVTDPGRILDKVRELIISSFGTGTHEVNDGMDISLCCWNPAIRTLQWAGANNPLWWVRNGQPGELKGDKQPVGRFSHSKAFTTHTMQVEPGDRFYLFSDGYADQFGGAEGKKFKYKQLKDLLLANAALTPEQQKQKLQENFTRWKGPLEQIDDVCIMGVRLV